MYQYGAVYEPSTAPRIISLAPVYLCFVCGAIMSQRLEHSQYASAICNQHTVILHEQAPGSS